MLQLPSSLTRLALISSAAIGVALAAPVQAANTEQMIKTATDACLNRATETGYNAELSKVLSSKVIDADKVEVVLDLTKDGGGYDRLTCPYSVKEGLIGSFGKLNLPGAPEGLQAISRNRLWWLLLPIGAALVGYSALRGRDPEVGAGSYGSYGGDAINVVADAPNGTLEVRDHADGGSTVRRRLRNGETIALSGRRQGDWVEALNGGWVLDRELRYDRNSVRFS
ncbi:MAG: hypothetical protein R6W06_07060 [Prochlorococcaceae cyanobacterium]